MGLQGAPQLVVSFAVGTREAGSSRFAKNTLRTQCVTKIQHFAGLALLLFNTSVQKVVMKVPSYCQIVDERRRVALAKALDSPVRAWSRRNFRWFPPSLSKSFIRSCTPSRPKPASQSR